MKSLLLVTVMLISSLHLNAQLVLTDFIDLGEDQSSHSYMAYNPNGGNTVQVGAYDCDGNLGINIGGDNIHDSITFYFDVTPNVDMVRIHWVLNWFNNTDGITTIVVENNFESELYGNGAALIGSDPLNCDKSTHFLDFTGLSNYTADGQIKIKVYDPGVSWGGNCTISWMEVLSDTTAVASVDNFDVAAHTIKVYPNPADNFLVIQTPEFSSTATLSITNINGQKISSRLLDNSFSKETTLDMSSYESGFYFYSITGKEFNYQGKFQIQH